MVTTPPHNTGDTTMLTKTKIALVALTLISSASMASAEYDGDGNQIPGTQQNVVVRQAPASIEGSFASERATMNGLTAWEKAFADRLSRVH
jgi:hypothetical protein